MADHRADGALRITKIAADRAEAVAQCVRRDASKARHLRQPSQRAGNATICLTDGRTATQIAFEEDLTNVLTLDLARDFATTKRVALAKGEDTTSGAVADAVALFKTLGVEVTMVGDVPGMIVARTVAMLANEAADAVLQGVADAAGVDTAMKLGVSYPEGPLAAADRYGLTLMNAILVNMQAHTGDDRYRQSLLLQRKMWSDGSFT